MVCAGDDERIVRFDTGRRDLFSGVRRYCLGQCYNAQEDRYKSILHNLAPKQRQLLVAIAKDRKVDGITSADFVKKHFLTSASSVQAALKPLLKSDIVTCEEGVYRIYDYFFADYLAKR